MRVREIVRVLAGHGFSELVDRIQLTKHVPLLSRFRPGAPKEAETLSPAERARLTLQELGPTFIKFGQVLATRPDIIPEDFAEEFRRLQDDVEPFGAEEARAIVETELGSPLEDLFESFSAEAAGSGSIAQIHFATLTGGAEVVVKVQRPGIGKKIASDLDILYNLAKLAERRVPDLKVYRPVMLVEEFRRNLERELDFRAEASAIGRLRTELASDRKVRIPEVHWNRSTSKVLTLERMHGTPLTDLAGLEAAGLDKAAMARTIAGSFMRQFFEVGLFHADPHPGNIFASEDGTVALLDFGSVGTLGRELKGQLAATLVALDQGDLDLIIDIHTETGLFSDTRDISRLRSDLADLVGRYYGMPAGHIDMAAVFSDVVATARRNEIVLPREFVLLGRSLVLVVGLCQRLDASFNVAEVIRPHLKRIFVSDLKPAKLVSRWGLGLHMLAGFFRRLPREVGLILRRANRGELEIKLRHENLEGLATEIEVASNRIAFSVVTGAIVVASSLLLHAQVKPHVSLLTDLVGLEGLGDWKDLSLFGLGGFLIAFFFGLKLLWDIARSGKLGR